MVIQCYELKDNKQMYNGNCVSDKCIQQENWKNSIKLENLNGNDLFSCDSFNERNADIEHHQDYNYLDCIDGWNYLNLFGK